MTRYDELLAAVPRGSMYAAQGQVLPYQDAAHDLQYYTDAASTVFGVFVDNRFIGEVTSDTYGVATVSVKLAAGEHVITIENDDSGRRFRSYVTIRHSATWHAAIAQALTGTATFVGIDSATDSVAAAGSLRDADARHIGESQGKVVAQPNDIGFVTNTYRFALARLRTAYRKLAGKPEGLRQVVQAFTGINPFVVPRAWRPVWWLGTQLLDNPELRRVRDTSTTILPDLNLESVDQVAWFFSDASSITVLAQPPVPQVLTVSFTPFNGEATVWDGGIVTVTGTAPGGAVVSETFDPVDVALDLDGDSTDDTVLGTQVFETVTSITHDTTGAGSPAEAAVGFGVTRFVTVTGFEGSDTTGVAHDLTFIRTGAAVHAATIEADTASAPGPFTDPPEPQIIAITYPDDWDSSAITVTGTDTAGGAQSEVIPVSAGNRVVGTLRFATVTAATHAGTGSSGVFASIGLQADAMVWRDNALTAPDGNPTWLPRSGTYTVPGPRGTATFIGLAAETFAITANSNDRLYLEVGTRGVLTVILTAGAAPAAQIVTDINTAAVADVRYGQNLATTVTGSGYTGVAVRLFGANYNDSYGTAGTLRIHPGAMDAAATVFGLPRFDAALSAPTGGAFATSLTYTTSGSRLPDSDTLRLRVGRGLRQAFTAGTVVSSAALSEFTATAQLTGTLPFMEHYKYVRAAFTATTAVSFTNPPTPQALAVFFDSTWDRGNVTLHGTDANGATRSEVFASTPGYAVLGSVVFDTVTSATVASAGSAGSAYVGLQHKRDTGGTVRINSGANAGAHDIVAVLSWDRVLLRHETAFSGGVFTAGAVTNWDLWTPGQIVETTAHDATTGVLTIGDDGVVFATAATNPLVELADEVPYTQYGKNGDGAVIVDVDLDYAPTGTTTTDTVTLVGQAEPDGWRVLNSSAVSVCQNAYFGSSKLIITRGSSDAAVRCTVPRALPAYRGMELRISFWVQQHTAGNQNFILAVAWDAAGSSFTNLVTTAVAPTALDNTDVRSQLDPSLVTATVIVPYDAELMTIKLTHDGAASGDRWSFERASVEAVTHTALYLGHNTVPRNEHRGANSEVIYVWSPDSLDPDDAVTPVSQAWAQSTSDAIGLGGAGHIQRILPAQAYPEPFDVSEYDGSGVLVNGLSSRDETTGDDRGWRDATLTNMIIEYGSPGRMTEVRPWRVDNTVHAAFSADTSSGFTDPDSAQALQLYFTADWDRGTVTLVGTDSNSLTITESVTPEPGTVVTTLSSFATVTSADVELAGSAGTVTIGVAQDNQGASLVTGETLAMSGGGVASTRYTSRAEGSFPVDPDGTAVLYHDGVPVPDSADASAVQPWQWSTADEVTLDPSEYSSSAEYVLDYEILVRAETPVLDFSASYDDYLWLADAAMYLRRPATQVTRATTEQVTFLANGRATLTYASDQDQSAAVLTADDGLNSSVVSTLDWRFVDSRTIELLTGAETDVVYSIEYTRVDNLFDPPVSYVLEHRSGASAIAAAAATYAEIEQDAPLPNTDRYHQLRITFSGVTDATDLRLTSLGARGVQLYSAAPYAPGIIID